MAANGAAAVLGFAQAVVLGRALGAGGYGLLSLVIVFATLFNQLFDIRLWETVTKFVSEYHERGEHGHARAVIKLAYLFDSSCGVAAFALVVVAAPLAAGHLFHRPEAAGLMVAYSVTLLVATVNQTSQALLRVFDRFAWLSGERITFAALRFGALWVVAVRTGALRPIIWTYVATDLLRAAWLAALALRSARGELHQPGPSRLALLRPRLRELIGFSVHNALTMMLSLVTRQLDVLILAALRPDQEVGLYRMAKNFVQLVLRLSDPVYQAIYPELVRLREQVATLAPIRSFIVQAMSRVLLLLGPLAIMIGVGSPILISMTVGSEFLPAAPAVRIMIIGILVNVALLWARPLALTAGRPAISTAAFGAAALVLLAGSALLVPARGYLGSALTYLATMSTAAGWTAIGAVRAARAQQRARQGAGERERA